MKFLAQHNTTQHNSLLTPRSALAPVIVSFAALLRVVVLVFVSRGVQSLGLELTRQVFRQKNRNLPIVEVLCESLGLPREYILNLASVDI